MTFNSGYYPTPVALADKLLSGLDFNRRSNILEPSAGKGDLVKAIIRKSQAIFGREYFCDVDCIEYDKNLQQLLKYQFSKEHKQDLQKKVMDSVDQSKIHAIDRELDFLRGEVRLVHDDFLTFHTFKQYDLIVMNPPFDSGDKHLLKAISLQKKYGGEIRCILNAETLKNPFSNTRKELARRLQELNAVVEYEQHAFSNAERKTDVEVAIVQINIPKKQIKSMLFDELKAATNESKQSVYRSEDIITNDFIKGIVQQYNFEIELGIKMIDEFAFMSSKILSSFEKGREILALTLNEYSSHGSPDVVTPNEFIKRVREKYWKTLFGNKEFSQLLTSNMKDEYLSKIEELVNYDFSLFNIYSIRLDISKQTEKNVGESIIALFEKYSNTHSWFDECSKNIHYYNGWKTNKSYIVGKKVIIPCRLSLACGYKYIDCKRIDFTRISGNTQEIIDTEKVFNYLNGGLVEGEDICDVLAEAGTNGQTSKIKCKYFDLTFYKKGTCHITFTNETLLKKFNIFGSQRKGWLPPTYGKKEYEELSEEEKQVIDEFDGEENYKKVTNNSKYYLFNASSIPLLAELN